MFRRRRRRALETKKTRRIPRKRRGKGKKEIVSLWSLSYFAPRALLTYNVTVLVELMRGRVQCMSEIWASKAVYGHVLTVESSLFNAHLHTVEGLINDEPERGEGEGGEGESGDESAESGEGEEDGEGEGEGERKKKRKRKGVILLCMQWFCSSCVCVCVCVLSSR